ncbi:hypothetical protein HRbin25_00956 [bacterium HR25]|nr:hypothetical protein HRbin25_00956 [bacterium HR25]
MTQQLLETIGERIRATADIRVVYGEPIVVGERTIVPVAAVSYMFGAGGGKGSRQGQEGEGGGGGGSVRVRPLGVIEVTPQGTRFVPVFDTQRLALYALGAVALVALAWRRYLRYLERRR